MRPLWPLLCIDSPDISRRSTSAEESRKWHSGGSFHWRTSHPADALGGVPVVRRDLPKYRQGGLPLATSHGGPGPEVVNQVREVRGLAVLAVVRGIAADLGTASALRR